MKKRKIVSLVVLCVVLFSLFLFGVKISRNRDSSYQIRIKGLTAEQMEQMEGTTLQKDNQIMKFGKDGIATITSSKQGRK